MSTALVTGAATGMGALAAQRLAAAGWEVIAVDVDKEGLARTALRSPTMHTRICDVSDGGALREVVAEAGPLRRVVHAAALSPAAPALDQTVEEVERVTRVNYLGTVQVVHAVLPGMLERGHGELVLFSSLAGLLPMPKFSAYAAAKAAINAYAEVLLREYGGQGVKIRCVCPRQVDTPGFRAMAARDPSATGGMKGMPPGRVLDAIERSLRGPDTDLYVLPDALTRLTAAMRRHAPGPLDRLLGKWGAT